MTEHKRWCPASQPCNYGAGEGLEGSWERPEIEDFLDAKDCDVCDGCYRKECLPELTN